MKHSLLPLAICILLTGAFGTSARSADEPAELVKLRGNFEEAVFREIAPIQKKYKEHLLKMRSEFSKKGDKDAVDAISAELRSLVDPRITAAYRETGEVKPKEADGDKLQEWLNERKFVWKGTNADEVVIKFKGDEAQVYADRRKIMERVFEVVSPNVIQFDWGNGDINTFTISDSKKEFRRFMKKSGETHGGQIKRG